MALFKRNTLKDKGLTEEQIDFIMNEGNRVLASDYELKSDRQAAIDAAIAEAQKNIPAPNVKESEEYKALETEFATYKDKQTARMSEDFKGVKAKFFDTVYDKIDRSKPVPAQLESLKKDFEEYFEPEKTENKPTFGAQSTGGMLAGNDKKDFASLWGLKRNES